MQHPSVCLARKGKRHAATSSDPTRLWLPRQNSARKHIKNLDGPAALKQKRPRRDGDIWLICGEIRLKPCSAPWPKPTIQLSAPLMMRLDSGFGAYKRPFDGEHDVRETSSPFRNVHLNSFWVSIPSYDYLSDGFKQQASRLPVTALRQLPSIYLTLFKLRGKHSIWCVSSLYIFRFSFSCSCLIFSHLP